VFATAADYHGRSYYTYRWRPAAHLKTHVFRALDDALFKTDWVERRSRQPLSPSQTQFFPSPAIEPRWDSPKRQQVANELNRLDDFDQDVEGAMAYYRELSNDALRVLAGLPGNERAFTQLTIQPLDPDDPSNADRRGPDSPDGYVPNPNLRAYEDSLDGRSTNRYFYRAAYADGAHNRSDLSLSSPPVYLPNVVPPHTPIITRVLGGDSQITLTWASNREPDLASYRLYRTYGERDACDLRLMTLVHTEIVSPGDPATRPPEISWSDTPVEGNVTIYYRFVALDEAQNASSPSAPVAARAFDSSPPDPPVWDRIEWVHVDAHGIEHSFTSVPPPGETWERAVAVGWATPARHRTLLQRRHTDRDSWDRVSGWLEAKRFDHARQMWLYSTYDFQANPSDVYWYRIKVESRTGSLNTTFDERELAAQ
jgi:hypothetical protein